MDFVHLHVHTEFSVLDGLSKIPELLDKARRCGMKAMAITDHGVMGGIKMFVDAVDKMNAKPANDLEDCMKKIKDCNDPGKLEELEKEREKLQAALDNYVPFKPICGVEAYCARRSRFSKDGQYKEYDAGWGKERAIDKSGWHLILLAKNKTGYFNLCKLVSLSYTEGYYMKPRIDKELLEKYHEGIIACSACLGGEIPSKILAGKIEEAEEAVLWFKNLFGDDYYLELQRHKTDKPNANVEVYERQCEVNPVLVQLARKHGIKLIATNDVHFVEEEHSEAHEKLLWINTNKGGSGKAADDEDSGVKQSEDSSGGRRSEMTYSKQEWFKSTEEMSEIFSDLPEALQNTVEIADKVEAFSLNSDALMPRFDIPEEFGTEEEYRRKFTADELITEFTCDEHGNPNTDKDAVTKKIKKLGGADKLYRIKLEADYLAKLAWEGAKYRYGEKLTDEQKERIEFELYIMKTMGFPGYFLIVQDYIKAAREQLGVSVGPGRGSAAGSVVAYCLRITDVDPLKYDLLFERFLNPDRISMPDIDVDFEDSGRDAVLDYVGRKYGKERVAHIITYGTMAAKSAIADVARVMDVRPDMSAKLRSYIPDKFSESVKDASGKTPKVNIKNCIKYVPDMNKVRYGDDTVLSEVVEYASQLEGTIRNLGVHACGVIIGSDDISNLAPMQTVPDTKNKDNDILVTEYDGHFVESVGLIKMDFLGLSTLTIIKEAVANVKKSRGIEIDIDHIPIDDPLTYQLYSEGRTVGTFQFESAGMRRYLKELKPTQFEDLIAMNALYRPGPMEYIPQFIARKSGREPITYDIPVMERYLKDTYGITVYQEQVMLLSRLLAGFTRGESDTLRKAMGKKLVEVLNNLKGKFMDGGKANGHDEKILEKIWHDWEQFAKYAFNKSHATCYSWVAYQTAYLKAHYPSEFMAANLTVSKDSTTDVAKFMEECKNMGIRVLLPDVNESFDHFMPNSKGDIRFGLGGIKDLGGNAIEAIIKEREKNGKFKDLLDFMQRVSPADCNKKSLEALALSGALDSLCDGKRELFFMSAGSKGETYSEMLLRYASRYQAETGAAASLFGDATFGIEPPQAPEYVPWSILERLKEEREHIGMYLSAHPLDDYAAEMKWCTHNMVQLSDNEYLADHDMNNRTVRVGGIVTDAKIDRTKKSNQQYLKVTVSDFTGSYTFVIFGKQMQLFEPQLQVNNYVILTGQVMERKNNLQNTEQTEYQVRINSIVQMEELRQREWILTLALSIQGINNDLLEALLKNKCKPGHKGKSVVAALKMEIWDDEKHLDLRMKSNSKYVVDLSLLNRLQALQSETDGRIRYKLAPAS